jgi:hypothetical protein
MYTTDGPGQVCPTGSAEPAMKTLLDLFAMFNMRLPSRLFILGTIITMTTEKGFVSFVTLLFHPHSMEISHVYQL